MRSACGASRSPVIFASTNKVYGDLGDLAIVSQNPIATSRKACSQGAASAKRGRSISTRPMAAPRARPISTYWITRAASASPRVVFRMSCIYGHRQMGTEDQGWVAHFLIRALAGRADHALRRRLAGARHPRRVGCGRRLCQALERIDDVAGSAFNLGGGPSNAVSLLELLDEIRAVTAGASNSTSAIGVRATSAGTFPTLRGARGARPGRAARLAQRRGDGLRLARVRAWPAPRRTKPAFAEARRNEPAANADDRPMRSAACGTYTIELAPRACSAWRARRCSRCWGRRPTTQQLAMAGRHRSSWIPACRSTGLRSIPAKSAVRVITIAQLADVSGPISSSCNSAASPATYRSSSRSSSSQHSCVASWWDAVRGGRLPARVRMAARHDRGRVEPRGCGRCADRGIRRGRSARIYDLLDACARRAQRAHARGHRQTARRSNSVVHRRPAVGQRQERRERWTTRRRCLAVPVRGGRTARAGRMAARHRSRISIRSARSSERTIAASGRAPGLCLGGTVRAVRPRGARGGAGGLPASAVGYSHVPRIVGRTWRCSWPATRWRERFAAAIGDAAQQSGIAHRDRPRGAKPRGAVRARGDGSGDAAGL